MPCSSARRAARQRPADRAPPALDQHLRPRQPEPALLAQRQRPGADALQQVGVVDGRQPLPRHRLGLAAPSRRRLRPARAAARTSRSGTCARRAAGSPSGRGSRPPRALSMNCATARSWRSTAASTSAGPRSRPRSWTRRDHQVLGAKRDQTPLKGGPKAIAAQHGRRAAGGRRGGRARARATSTGVGVGSPGSVDDEKGTVSGAMNLSEWAGTFNLRKALEKELGVAGLARQRRRPRHRRRVRDRRGQASTSSLLGVFWGTGVGGGLILDGKPWVGRRTAGEIGHMVVRINGAQCGCGRRGCMEAYAGRGAMEARARRRVEQGEKTALFKIMEERGRDRLSSRHLGARAGPRRPDGARAARRGRRGARRGRRLARSTCSTRRPS